MDPELLNLPLEVKIPVAPGSKRVFSRGKLGERVHRPFPYFTLDDPYLYLFNPKYSCLHDPHLRDYHRRKHILQMLKRQGVITGDNNVVCTLKEFNEYRMYLTRSKLQSEQILRRQEEGLLPSQAKLKDGFKLLGTTHTSCQRKRRLQPQKPPKGRKLGGCRKGRAALNKGQTYSRAELGQEDAELGQEDAELGQEDAELGQEDAELGQEDAELGQEDAELGQEDAGLGQEDARLGQEDAELSRRASTAADSQRKPESTDSGVLNAAFEQSTLAEAKKLEELAESVVHSVLERLNFPGNQHVSFLQRVAQGIRGRLLGSCLRAELSDTSLDHHQKMEVMAKELVATVLEILGDHLASSTYNASEPGKAASWKEQPVDGEATQADKSKDTETATESEDRTLSQASLDKLTREVVESVHCTLESFVTSQFEQDTSCEILELPGGNVSNTQLLPSQTLPRQSMEAGKGFSRAPEQQSLEAMLPAPAEGAGCAKTMEPEVKQNLERKRNLKSTASIDTLDIRTMANQIAGSVLEQISQPGPAPAPEESFQGPVENPPTAQAGKESCATEDTLPSVDP